MHCSVVLLPWSWRQLHALASLNQETSVFYTPKVDDDDSQSDDDPVEDELPAELALKQPNKFSESLVIEVSLRC